MYLVNSYFKPLKGNLKSVIQLQNIIYFSFLFKSSLYDIDILSSNRFLRETLKPSVKTEEQLLFLCHLFGPFLQRLHSEKTKCLMEVHIFI